MQGYAVRLYTGKFIGIVSDGIHYFPVIDKNGFRGKPDALGRVAEPTLLFDTEQEAVAAADKYAKELERVNTR